MTNTVANCQTLMMTGTDNLLPLHWSGHPYKVSCLSSILHFKKIKQAAKSDTKIYHDVGDACVDDDTVKGSHHS